MLQNYLRVALRNLRKNMSYTSLNMLGLGLGMAGAVLIFLFIQFHLGTDRHQPHRDRLYRTVLDLHLDEGIEHEPGSAYALATALGSEYAGVEKVGFVRRLPMVTFTSGTGDKAKSFMEKDRIAYADQGYMELFAFNWLGHKAAASLREPFTVIVSQKLARKYFGTDDVIGKIILLDHSHNLKVTGIIKDDDRPSDFAFDAFISLPTIKTLDPGGWISDFTWTSSRNFTFVKLNPNASAARVEQMIAGNGKKYYGDNAHYFTHRLQPLSDIHFDENYDGKIGRTILWVLAGVGFFLMLIACINFINMATAQAVNRSREIGVRKVLGGTRQQLFRQFMTETALLTCLAGVFSLLLILPLMTVLNNWTQTQAFRFGGLFQLDVLLFMAVALITIVLLAGFYPSVIVSGFNPVAALKSRFGTGQAGAFNLRRSLVTVQLTIAQTMIAGTLVLMLQMHYFRNADLGFDQKAIVKVTLPKTDPAPAHRETFRTGLEQYPEIRSVSYQYDAPTSDMGFGGSVRFDNRVEWEKFVIRVRFGDAHYLKTYRMPLLAGRSFSERDSVHEFVVNEEFMKKLGIRDPEQMIGRAMEDGTSGYHGRIVGVVKNFHHKSLHTAIEPCAIYAQPEQYREVAIKLDAADLPRSISRIRAVWEKTYPSEVFSYEFAEEKIASLYASEEQLTSLIRLFAGVAVVICCLGLFGMVSFMVTRKTKEIGVRKVLGADVSSILMLFGREFVVMILAAFVISAPVSWVLLTHWLNHFTYHIHLHWWLIAAGGLIILPITALTVGYKVTQAAWMNPVKSLSQE